MYQNIIDETIYTITLLGFLKFNFWGINTLEIEVKRKELN
jgi:hypothetical protein